MNKLIDVAHIILVMVAINFSAIAIAGLFYLAC